MKKLIVLLSLLVVAVINGCATSPELIRAAGTGTRSDVFQELADGGAIPPGYADLRISSSLKTHSPGIYSAKDFHGTPEYKLLVNIDGQAAQMQGTLTPENSEARGLRDPEAGGGVRYRFSKNLRLKAGKHRIIIGVLEDEIAIEREVTLAEGTHNSLVLEPSYRGTPSKRRPGFYGETSYKEGLKGFRVVLNGEAL